MLPLIPLILLGLLTGSDKHATKREARKLREATEASLTDKQRELLKLERFSRGDFD